LPLTPTSHKKWKAALKRGAQWARAQGPITRGPRIKCEDLLIRETNIFEEIMPTFRKILEDLFVPRAPLGLTPPVIKEMTR